LQNIKQLFLNKYREKMSKIIEYLSNKLEEETTRIADHKEEREKWFQENAHEWDNIKVQAFHKNTCDLEGQQKMVELFGHMVNIAKTKENQLLLEKVRAEVHVLLKFRTILERKGIDFNTSRSYQFNLAKFGGMIAMLNAAGVDCDEFDWICPSWGGENRYIGGALRETSLSSK